MRCLGASRRQVMTSVLLESLIVAVVASLVGLGLGVLIASGRGDRQLKLPFGTFLAVAAMLAGLFGQELVTWYAGLLG